MDDFWENGTRSVKETLLRIVYDSETLTEIQKKIAKEVVMTTEKVSSLHQDISYSVEVEKKKTSNIDIEELREKLAHEIKVDLGVKAQKVIILEEGELPRATHKAKRLIDERKEVQ